jgi:hypothetical protein
LPEICRRRAPTPLGVGHSQGNAAGPGWLASTRIRSSEAPTSFQTYQRLVDRILIEESALVSVLGHVNHDLDRGARLREMLPQDQRAAPKRLDHPDFRA